MLSKTIKFEDWNGTEREEDFYFNLSEAELMEMEMSTTGGFTNMMNSIIRKKDVPQLMSTFKNLILKSYGEKSEDGRRFIKSPKLSEEFMQTPAYDQLFMELCTDANAASAFVNGIVPKKLADKAKTAEVQKQLKNHPAIKSK